MSFLPDWEDRYIDVTDPSFPAAKRRGLLVVGICALVGAAVVAGLVIVGAA